MTTLGKAVAALGVSVHTTVPTPVPTERYAVIEEPTDAPVKRFQAGMDGMALTVSVTVYGREGEDNTDLALAFAQVKALKYDTLTHPLAPGATSARVTSTLPPSFLLDAKRPSFTVRFVFKRLE